MSVSPEDQVIIDSFGERLSDEQRAMFVIVFSRPEYTLEAIQMRIKYAKDVELIQAITKSAEASTK